MNLAALSLGSNLGGESQIEAALAALARFGNLAAVSGLYASAPMYVEDQPDFVNAACLLETELGPLALIRQIKMIESDMGRQARERNGPREIDIDIVAYGVLRLRSNAPPLQIPHPRASERRFVLEPLHEIAPSLHLPSLGTVESLLARPEIQNQALRRIRDAQISIHRD